MMLSPHNDSEDEDMSNSQILGYSLGFPLVFIALVLTLTLLVVLTVWNIWRKQKKKPEQQIQMESLATVNSKF